MKRVQNYYGMKWIKHFQVSELSRPQNVSNDCLETPCLQSRLLNDRQLEQALGVSAFPGTRRGISNDLPSVLCGTVVIRVTLKPHPLDSPRLHLPFNSMGVRVVCDSIPLLSYPIGLLQHRDPRNFRSPQSWGCLTQRHWSCRIFPYQPFHLMQFSPIPGVLKRLPFKKRHLQPELQRKDGPRLPKLASSHLALAWRMLGLIHVASTSRVALS